MSATGKTIVIGGGITGLTAAWSLMRDGREVELLEAGPRAGGAIRTEKLDGFLVELGPNTLQETREETARLLIELGLDEKRIPAGGSAKNRFILRDGKPRPLPLSPFSLFFGNFFSPAARLRILAEPFVRRAPADEVETMEVFIRRRLGQEPLDYAIDPFVAGTFAARPRDIALKYAFPRLHHMEQQYGSLIKGALFGKRYRPRGPRGIFSFAEGLRAIPDALAGRLGETVRTAVRVTGIERKPGESSWRVNAEGDRPDGPREAGSIVFALPPHALKDIRINGRSFEDRLSLKNRLPAPPLAVLFLGYRRDQVRHSLDGFGMLVPEKENRKILGALFSSSLFEGRAPRDHVSLTVFVGGSRQPELATLPEAERETLVRRELAELLGVEGTPAVLRHALWPNVIPHYSTQHGVLIDDLDRVERDHPGVFIGGPVRQGVSLGDCMASGYSLAERVEKLVDNPAKA